MNAGDVLVQPIIQEYRLRFSAPDDESLARVDDLFIHTFNSEDVSLEKVGSFYEITRQEAASEYAEALADYVRAALIKDGDKRTGVSSRLHHYHDIQNRALGILQSFDRPVANLLCALMRFGLNDFSRWQEKTGVAKLDEANATLGPLAFPGQEQLRVAEAEESKTNVVRFVFPVDIGTDTVTQLAKQASTLSRWGSAAEKLFDEVADRAAVDNLDRAKIRALWTATALRLSATESAERALRLLDGDPTFGASANDKLARSKCERHRVTRRRQRLQKTLGPSDNLSRSPKHFRSSLWQRVRRQRASCKPSERGRLCPTMIWIARTKS